MSDDLNSIMGTDHVIRVREDGTMEDAPNIYAPEAYVSTDQDGQISDDDERTMVESLRAQGWELLTGWTCQYGYNGPIMHPSEYIGGALADHIRETSGIYVAVMVETLDDDEEPAGWAIAYRPAA